MSVERPVYYAPIYAIPGKEKKVSTVSFTVVLETYRIAHSLFHPLFSLPSRFSPRFLSWYKVSWVYFDTIDAQNQVMYHPGIRQKREKEKRRLRLRSRGGEREERLKDRDRKKNR